MYSSSQVDQINDWATSGQVSDVGGGVQATRRRACRDRMWSASGESTRQAGEHEELPKRGGLSKSKTWKAQIAQPIQVDAAGRATSRSAAIASPHLSHVPYRPCLLLWSAPSISLSRQSD